MLQADEQWREQRAPTAGTAIPSSPLHALLEETNACHLIDDGEIAWEVWLPERVPLEDAHRGRETCYHVFRCTDRHEKAHPDWLDVPATLTGAAPWAGVDH